MQLPAALSQTTLGDLLGTLHRGRSYGVLELVEAPSGWVHEIHLWDGYVVGVHVTRGCVSLGEVLCRRSSDPLLPGAVRRALLRLADGRPLGERLLATGVVSRAELSAALLELYRERLDFIERLPAAQVRFRPLKSSTSTDLQLGPASFLHGRRRTREQAPRPATNGPRRTATGSAESRANHSRATEPRAPQATLATDYHVLGLLPGASLSEVKQAFRVAVRRHHPDRSVHLGEGATKRAEARFRAIVESYQRICSRENATLVA